MATVYFKGCIGFIYLYWFYKMNFTQLCYNCVDWTLGKWIWQDTYKATEVYRVYKVETCISEEWKGLKKTTDVFLSKQIDSAVKKEEWFWCWEVVQCYLLFAGVARAGRGRDRRLLRDGGRKLATGAGSIGYRARQREKGIAIKCKCKTQG